MVDVTRFAFTLDSHAEKCTVIVPVRGQPNVHTVGDIVRMLHQRLLKKYSTDTSGGVDRLILDNGDELDPAVNDEDTIDCFWSGPGTHRVLVKIRTKSPAGNTGSGPDSVFLPDITAKACRAGKDRRWRELAAPQPKQHPVNQGHQGPAVHHADRSALSDHLEELHFNEGRDRDLLLQEEHRHHQSLVNFLLVKQQEDVSAAEGRARQLLVNAEVIAWEDLRSRAAHERGEEEPRSDGFCSRELSRHQRLRFIDEEQTARVLAQTTEESVRRRVVLEHEHYLLELTVAAEFGRRSRALLHDEAGARKALTADEAAQRSRVAALLGGVLAAATARLHLVGEEDQGRAAIAAAAAAEVDALLQAVSALQAGVLAERQDELRGWEEEGRGALQREYYRVMDADVWQPLTEHRQLESYFAVHQQSLLEECLAQRRIMEGEVAACLRDVHNGLVEGVIRHRIKCEQRWRKIRLMLDEAEETSRSELVQVEARKRSMFMRLFWEASQKMPVLPARSSPTPPAAARPKALPRASAQEAAVRQHVPVPPGVLQEVHARGAKAKPRACAAPAAPVADAASDVCDTASLPALCEPVD